MTSRPWRVAARISANTTNSTKSESVKFTAWPESGGRSMAMSDQNPAVKGIKLPKHRKKCERYRSAARRERNKRLKAIRHEKTVARFLARHDETVKRLAAKRKVNREKAA